MRLLEVTSLLRPSHVSLAWPLYWPDAQIPLTISAAPMLASFGDSLLVSPSAGPARFTTVAEDGLLSLYDTASGALVTQHARPTHLAVRYTCMAYWLESSDAGSAPGGRLALGTDSGVVVVWDLALGRIVHELRGHTQHVLDVAFEADGDTLLSSARDRQVCCWRVASGELLHTFAAGQAPAQRLAPTASGEHILLGSTALRLLKRKTWKSAGKVPGHASRVSCLCLAPDDRLAASAAEDDRHVSIWRVTPQALGDDAEDACVQTLALETPIVELAFYRPPSGGGGDDAAAGDETRYALLVVTASGEVGVWSFTASAAFASKKASAKRTRRTKGGSPGGGHDATPLSPKPQCVVRVSPAPGGADASGDPQRIFSACFGGSASTLIVAHGSRVHPTLSRVHLGTADGGLVASREVARASGGLFAAATNDGAAAEGSARKAKRGREQQLGAMDTALPSQAKRRSGAAADDDEEEEEEAAVAAKAADAPKTKAEKKAAAAAKKAAAAAAAAGGDDGAAEEGDDDDGEEVREEVISSEVGGVPTFGQRLAAMEHVGGGDDAGGANSKRRPTAASQVAMLVQALQNGDAGMLDEALLIQDAATITSTVARLPMTSVIPFLEAVLQRVQGRPARVASLASWMRALLAQHAAYLMGQPQLLPMLTPLYQLIEERLSACACAHEPRTTERARLACLPVPAPRPTSHHPTPHHTT